MLSSEPKIDSILLKKEFHWLKRLVEEARRVSSERNCSSELQVRYTSRAAHLSSESSERNYKPIFRFNRDAWKYFSSKNRAILYYVAILAGISEFERYQLEELLTKNLGDAPLRTRVQQETTADYLLKSLLELETYEQRNLARQCKQIYDILRFNCIKLKKDKILNFQALFELEVEFVEAREPEPVQRHKGYRDHGSLGQDSIGLKPEQLNQLITDPGEILFFESEGYYTEDIALWYQDPINFLSNIWRTYLE